MKTYVLENDKIRAVVREQSAELISLIKKEENREYLWNGDPKFWGWTSPVLFPLVGGLRDKTYRYQGKSYYMEKHGFARKRNFRLVSQSREEVWLSLEEDEESLEQYPFHFCLEIGYRVDGSSVKVMWKVHNKDRDTMYFSLGGHPALLCPLKEKQKKTDCYLGFETEKDNLDYLMVDPATQRIGDKVHSFHLEEGRHRITPEMFDYDALIFQDYQVQTACLAGPDREPYIRMHTRTPLTAFWSPAKDAPFVCFEPWYGRGDGVNFTGTLEERAWGQSVEGLGTFEAGYELEIM